MILSYLIFLILVGSFALWVSFDIKIKTNNLRNYMKTEVEKAKIFQSHTLIFKDFDKIERENLFSNCPLIHGFLLNSIEAFSCQGLDIDFSKLIQTEAIIDSSENQKKRWRKFNTELKNAPNRIKNLVRKQLNLTDKAIQLSMPKFYSLLKRKVFWKVINFIMIYKWYIFKKSCRKILGNSIKRMKDAFNILTFNDTICRQLGFKK